VSRTPEVSEDDVLKRRGTEETERRGERKQVGEEEEAVGEMRRKRH
jgi:hypothetical protein